MKWLVAVVACGACSAPAAAHGPPWVDGPTLPAARIEAGVSAVGDQLVVIGGFSDGPALTNEVDVIDTAELVGSGSSTAWIASGSSDPQAIPAFPEQWTHFQLAAVGTRLYVLGGLGGGLLGNNYVAFGDSFVFDTAEQDPTKRVWTPISPMPAGQERGSSGVVVIPPKIYLFGGASSSTPDPRAGALASNLSYDIEGDFWCPDATDPIACPPGDDLPDLPAVRSHPAAIAQSDGTFVVAGGLATLFSQDAQPDVWWLPPALGGQPRAWITKTSMPSARGGCAYGNIGGRLICAGGESVCNANTACALSSAYAYTPAQDGATPDHPWCRLTDLPGARAGGNGTAVGDRLFVAGGATALVLDPTSSLFVYSPGDDPALDPIPDTAHDTMLCEN
nr:hypothetical protein [Kofleriaceae bacterium]